MSYRNLLALLLLSYTGFASFGATNNVIRSAAQLFTATYVEPDARGRQFEFTAQVSTSCWKRKGKYITVEDSSGAMLVSAEHLEPDAIPVPGDKVTLSGLICTNARGDPIACCQSVRRLSSGTPTPFLDFSPQAFTSGNFNFRPVRIKGVVADAFLDEIDTDFIFFIINCGGERVTVSTESDGKSASDCWKLIGSAVSVSGICCPVTHGARMFLGRTIKTAPENITVLSPASDTPFAVPEIGNVRLLQPEQVATPERRRVKGIVLATWHARNILLKTPSGELSCVSTIDWRLPHAGDTIEAVGFPETDLLHINLTRCFWRSCPPLTNAAAPPTPVTINQLLVDADGRPRINHSYHGSPVILCGRVAGTPAYYGDHLRFILADNAAEIPVYIPNCPATAIHPNSIIKIYGTCVVDTEPWSPYSSIPRVRELLIFAPNMSKVHTLAGPPWWTPSRLLGALGGLVLAICGFIIWNLSLKRVLTRKSKALEREISARLESNLKTRERTRLAVELHDSISQNLSGMAMEIGTAVRVAPTGIENMMPHLNIASRTLQSCRDDLRDCLWDLRSNALEETDMNDAISKTLCPYLKPDTALHVRFNVPRNALSDNTAHTLLRIVRELVSNALRHGSATEIKIAGTIDGRQLLFSVQDNGCGFDPASSPGIAQGHFGLQGIRERIQRFNGKMRIEQIQPTGAKVTINMNISFPQEEDQVTP